MSVWGIVVAGGRGARFGSPKQFELLGESRLVDRAVSTAVATCDRVVLVLPPDISWDGPPVKTTVAGGVTRSDSVRAGLTCIPDEADVIVVHDAARPLASRDLFAAVVKAVRGGADAAVPALRVSDTVKQVDGQRVIATIPRDGLVAVQTPQAFRSSMLRDAHADNREASDDAALVETLGGAVVIVPGEHTNVKITTADDLVVASALLAAGQVPA
jgi:2-C-methyl-D-erythritol 4-phosphate cytidylyltransferase